jgi:hypothetical protein
MMMLSWQYDEWIDRSSERICPHGEHLKAASDRSKVPPTPSMDYWKENSR